jgi:hypothetical protein
LAAILKWEHLHHAGKRLKVFCAICEGIDYSLDTFDWQSAERTEVLRAKHNHLAPANRLSGCAKFQAVYVGKIWVCGRQQLGAERRALVFEHRDIESIWQLAQVLIRAWAQGALVSRGQECARVTVGRHRNPLRSQRVKSHLGNLWPVGWFTAICLANGRQIRAGVVKVEKVSTVKELGCVLCAHAITPDQVCLRLG